jgi:hypothetical protein
VMPDRSDVTADASDKRSGVCGTRCQRTSLPTQ